MGRPIQERKIGVGTAKIQVTSARFSTGPVVTGSSDQPLYIERQRSSLRFKIAQVGSTTTEVLKLVPKATPAAGEFSIMVTLDGIADGDLDDSSVYYVAKLHNKTVSVCLDDDETSMIHLPYTLQAGDNDQELLADGFILANIDAQA
jgi:hypothetical protein